jgi:hypothetical protein
MESSEDWLESLYAALRNVNDIELRNFRSAINSMFNPTLRERIVYDKAP